MTSAIEQMLVALLVLALTAVDAVKDGLRDGKNWPLYKCFPKWTNRQWLWHGLKWIGFYTPLYALLRYAGFDALGMAIVAIPALFIWIVLYRKTKGGFTNLPEERGF